MHRHRVLLVLVLLCAPATAWTQTGAEQPISTTASPMIPDPDTFPSAPSPPAPSPVASPPIEAAPEPWQLLKEIKFDATWLPGSGSDRLSIFDVELTATFNIPTIEGWAPVMITPYAAAHDWMGPSAAGSPALPSHLYDLNVEFGWRPRLAQWLFADLAITPGLYTDNKDVDDNSFRMRGRALAIVAFSEKLQIVGGVMYVNRNQIKVLPAGGVIWNPSDDLRCFLVFPQPKVSYRLATLGDGQLWGYLAGEFGGGRWEIERANGTPDSIDYTDIRVLVGVEWASGARLKEHVEVGYVFARKVTFTSDLPEYKPQDTVVLRAGVRY
jgi:hypothetical protein